MLVKVTTSLNSMVHSLNSPVSRKNTCKYWQWLENHNICLRLVCNDFFLVIILRSKTIQLQYMCPDMKDVDIGIFQI